MSVFRIEKNKNYTIMSNHHLRNFDLSLKAKGLLSFMLSLPEDWDYTLKGLSIVNREGVDAIREAIKELEKAGYVTRSRKRNEKGQLLGAEYVISEQPTFDEPVSEIPVSSEPALENPTQINKDIISKDLLITDLLNTNPFLSEKTEEPQNFVKGEAVEWKGAEAFGTYERLIKNNIEYGTLAKKHDIDRLDEIVSLILETVCTSRKTIRIASDDFPAEIVLSKFLKLNSQHIDFVFDCMKENTTKIRNIKKYLLAVLFNAPTTIDGYYTALVNHDIWQE